MVAIFISSLFLALETPSRDPQSLFAKVASTVEQVLLLLFTMEMCIKLFAWRWDYFKSSWNLLDFVVVITGYLTILIELAGAQPVGLRELRVLRTLRPLKLINKFPGLKLLVRSLLLSIPALSHA